MSTILENIATLKNNHFPDELNVIILTKLTVLLNITFGSALSSAGNVSYREMVTYNDNDQIDISYNFEFGVAFISFFRPLNQLTVSFCCSVNIDNLYHKDLNYCLTVDPNLNFETFSFDRFFEFSRNHDDKNKYTSIWSNLLFDIKMDNCLNVSKNLLYRNEEMYAIDEDDKQNLFDHGLNPLFYLSSRHFDELLLKFLNYCMRNKKDFYSIFSHYPTQINCMESLDKMVDFLNIFCEEYRDNRLILEYNIVLLDMQAI